MKRAISYFTFLLFFSLIGFSQNKLSPQQVLDRAARNIVSSKGVISDFSISTEGKIGKCTIKTAGEKFVVLLPDLKVWYNGKDMYTYNGKVGETTLTSPSQEELSEVNPFLHIRNWKADYSAIFSTAKKTGRHVIDLIPNKKGTVLKKITITIRESDLVPEKIVYYPTSGKPTDINVISFNKNQGIKDSEFEYPKASYQKTEVIDLR